MLSNESHTLSPGTTTDTYPFPSLSGTLCSHQGWGHALPDTAAPSRASRTAPTAGTRGEPSGLGQAQQEERAAGAGAAIPGSPGGRGRVAGEAGRHSPAAGCGCPGGRGARRRRAAR